MYRGTTPTYVITLSTALNLEGISYLYIVFRQQNTVVSKKLLTTDLSKDYKLKVQLSQEETLKFKVGEMLIQIRGVTTEGTVFATTIGKDAVKPILLEGVI